LSLCCCSRIIWCHASLAIPCTCQKRVCIQRATYSQTDGLQVIDGIYQVAAPTAVPANKPVTPPRRAEHMHTLQPSPCNMSRVTFCCVKYYPPLCNHSSWNPCSKTGEGRPSAGRASNMSRHKAPLRPPHATPNLCCLVNQSMKHSACCRNCQC
ncbi:hypothetical protein COO60DRAFT_1501313, partial [Scenedesmus sp. NREL 46B-D3]